MEGGREGVRKGVEREGGGREGVRRVGTWRERVREIGREEGGSEGERGWMSNKKEG